MGTISVWEYQGHSYFNFSKELCFDYINTLYKLPLWNALRSPRVPVISKIWRIKVCELRWGFVEIPFNLLSLHLIHYWSSNLKVVHHPITAFMMIVLFFWWLLLTRFRNKHFSHSNFSFLKKQQPMRCWSALAKHNIPTNGKSYSNHFIGIY